MCYKERRGITTMRYAVNSAQVISEIVDGEAVMINLTTGNYYSLNESGSAVWALIESGAGTEEIVGRLAARYEAAENELEEAVTRLLEELRHEELVVPGDQDGSAPTPASEWGGERSPFEVPRLEKHSDMQDLILLDPVHEVGEQGWPHAARQD
jgi:Coenzyme PQQ synthesis protein D (PqqD)